MDRTPPKAPGFPLLGNTFDLLRDPLAFFLRMYRELGPVFRVSGPGRRYTVLAGPEANRRFVEWEASYFSSEPVYRPYGQDLGTPAFLVALDGEEHRSLRRELRPGFSREAIGPHLPQMIAGIDSILDRYQGGGVVNVRDLMQAMVVEQTSIGMGGCPVGGMFEEIRKFGPTFVGAGVGGFPGFLRWRPKYRMARRRVLKFLHQSICEHRVRKANGRPPDLIDLLLTAKMPEGRPLNEKEILATAQAPYSSSLVYVAATCGFMLYELLRNPELLDRVRSEVDALFADGPDLAVLRRSPWLRAALLETQRMHTIAISAPRYVHRSFEYAGYRIDRGALTLTATAVTHFLPEYFPDPHTFDASRFIAPRNEHQQSGMLIPYGLGSHVCISAGVVDAVVMLTVGRLIHRYELALEPRDYKLGLSVMPFPAPSPKFKVCILKERARATSVAAGRTFEEELVDILPDVGAAALARASDRARIQQYPAGAVIIREGDPADAFFVITVGSAEVLKKSRNGELLAMLEAGDYFGEIGLLQNVPRTATVRASTAIEAIVLDRGAFFELIGEADLTSREIADVLRRRLISNSLASALPQLPRQQVERLWPQCAWLTFRPGATIVQQGEPAESFYVIVRGRVNVVNTVTGGREVFLCTLGEGEYFGEIGLLQNRPRTATVRAASDGPVELLALDRETFQAVTAGAAGERIAFTVAERLYQLAASG